MDPDRLVSLYERQSAKLDFANGLVAPFRKCGHEMHRLSSLRKICGWLDENHVRPSATAKEGAKWHPQRLHDYLYMDGSEPTRKIVRAKKERRDRDEGMRIAIHRMFESARAVLADPPQGKDWGSVLDWEERLHAHEMRILSIAQRLRTALGR